MPTEFKFQMGQFLAILDGECAVSIKLTIHRQPFQAFMGNIRCMQEYA
jgi:hypothetical protein